MEIKKHISRKDFIKGASATLSLLSLGIGGTADAAENRAQMAGYSSVPGTAPQNTGTRRGSWVSKTARTGTTALVTDNQKCVIVVNKAENSAVQQAVLFLAADIEKLTGYKPEIADKDNGSSQAICIATVSQQSPANIKAQLQHKHEAYYIKTDGRCIMLTGSDFRGTAFAVYALCERLGIDPLYHWTGYRPLKSKGLIVVDIDHYSPPPVFKYRGFFHDDEDVLPRPFEKTGYPLRVGDIDMAWYQRYFETTLRLGMNVSAPFCRVRRRYEVQKCASEWGLYYTSHHYDILLSNPFGIERYRLAERRGVSSEWDWFNHKDNMMKYWRGGVEENKDINAIWPVGLRGTDDHAYEFPANTPANVQARVFREAIETQVETVKNVAVNEKHPLFHFTMYTEMLDKYEQHSDEFNVPEDVIIVWPDNDDGVMRSLPSKTGKWKHGVYYHLAYFGKNISKQGPHTVSAMRVATEFKKIKKAEATEFLLVNVSEMREHVMEMRMIADLCANAALYSDDNLADNFIKWWITEYFGASNTTAAKAYMQYYALLDSPDKLWFGTDMVQDTLGSLIKKVSGQKYKEPEAAKTAALNARIEAYHAAIASIEAAQKSMGREQRQFFFENLSLGLLMDFRPCQAAAALIKALGAGTETTMWSFVDEALVPLQQLEAELQRAERTPFERWYGETWIKTDVSPLNYHRAYKQVREFISTGGNMEIKKRVAIGHNIPGARLWNDYLEGAERIHPTY